MPVISGYKRITQLPDGIVPLAGTELIEIVQAGVSVKVPSTAFPSTQAGLITIVNTPALPNSRTITAGLGITFQDNGPLGTLVINALAGVNFGNPTALVGLAAVNGVAPTAMRSDSAPALSQSIAPTWTGAHIFTNAAGIVINNTQPIYEVLESDAAANQRRWRMRAQGEQLLFSAVSDDGLTTGDIIVIDRTNEVIDNINLTATTVQVNGQSVRDAAILTSGTVGTARLGSGVANNTSFLRGDQTWQLATSIFAGFANPTASVGLAAVNGAATTAMRSDAAPALSVAISPTWSGTHTFSNPILEANGTNLLPAFSFSGDPNTGMYDVGADDLGFATGGVLRMDISTTQIVSTLVSVGPNGTALLPAYSFSGDPNTGMYNFGADDLGFATGGVVRLDISTTNLTSTLNLLGPNGLVGTPTFSFSGDPNTGMYNVGADSLGFSTNGVVRLNLTTTQMISTLVSVGPNGTALLPAYSFSGDPNTGIYNVGADDLGFATGGLLRMDIDLNGQLILAAPTSGATFTMNHLLGSTSTFQGPNTGVGWNLAFKDTTATAFRGFIGIGTGTAAGMANTDFGISPGASGRVVIGTANGAAIGAAFDATGHFLASDGSGPLPGMSFLADTDTGVYRINTNNMGIACGGSLICDFRSIGLVMDLGQFLALDGTVNNPGISFGSESGMGFYRRGAGQIAVAFGGVLGYSYNGGTSTGASTPGALSANKPGANNSVIAWMPVITAAGSQGWIPIWGN